MPEAAQLGAGDLPVADVGGVEPDLGRHARHRVLLDAKLGEEEGMDHVLAVEANDDLRADRKMELIERQDVVGCVELSVRARIADVPGELLRGDLELHRVFGHALLDLGPDAPREQGEDDADDRWNDRPDDFEPVVTVGVVRSPAFPMPVADQEVDQK